MGLICNARTLASPRMTAPGFCHKVTGPTLAGCGKRGDWHSGGRHGFIGCGKTSGFGVAQRFQRCDKCSHMNEALAAAVLESEFFRSLFRRAVSPPQQILPAPTTLPFLRRPFLISA